MEGDELVSTTGKGDEEEETVTIPQGHCWVLADNPDLRPPQVRVQLKPELLFGLKLFPAFFICSGQRCPSSTLLDLFTAWVCRVLCFECYVGALAVLWLPSQCWSGTLEISCPLLAPYLAAMYTCNVL